MVLKAKSIPVLSTRGEKTKTGIYDQRRQLSSQVGRSYES